MKLIIINYTADPLPEITWLKYGEKLEESLDVQIKQEVKDLQHGLKEIKYYLYFPAGRHCDTGSYTLQAKNKYGSVETSAHLDILLKPEIEGFKDQISVPFKTVTFEVNIHANPKPKVKDQESLVPTSCTPLFFSPNPLQRII